LAVSVVELATGKELRRIETGEVHGLAFSLDGRVLATSDDHIVHLWEVATGKEVYRLAQHGVLAGAPQQEEITCLAFLHSDGALATGMRDGTILVWGLAPKTQNGKELSSQELDGLWNNLASEDAAKTYRAIQLLAGAPEQAIPFVKERIEPASEIDAKRVERLLADLDSEDFSVRDAASKELAQLGDRAEPLLRRALDGQPSVELRTRLESLLSSPQAPSPATLRTLRANQILEQVGTAAACEILRKLAAGAAGARETRDAQEALKRLDRRHN
jgi:hypothetical protein